MWAGTQKSTKEYLHHCLEDQKCSGFYQTPLKKTKRFTLVWCYIGKNSKLVVSTTQLFQASVKEQIITSHTGHQSLDGVHMYKRVSEEQCQLVSSLPTCSSATNGMQESPHQNKIKLVHWQDHKERAS